MGGGETREVAVGDRGEVSLGVSVSRWSAKTVYYCNTWGRCSDDDLYLLPLTSIRIPMVIIITRKPRDNSNNSATARHNYLQQSPLNDLRDIQSVKITLVNMAPLFTMLSLLGLLTCLSSATALTYKMPPNGKECFYSYVPTQGAKIAFYYAVCLPS